MKTILVDDIPETMRGFEHECRDSHDVDIIGMFTSSTQALEFAQENSVEFALLDIDMPELNGLELAKKLKEINPLMIIMFVTAHAEYAVDAMKMKADYIVFKPFDHDDVVDAISRAKLLMERNKPRVRIQTFGSFMVFVDGKHLHFSSKKAKELLAFCVANNGRALTSNEIIFTLWEEFDGNVKECSNYRSAIKRLRDDLTKYGVEDIFVHDAKMTMVRRNMIDCDYFHFMDGENEYVMKLDEEFMTDYSWAENFIYRLLDFKRNYLQSKITAR